MNGSALLRLMDMTARQLPADGSDAGTDDAAVGAGPVPPRACAPGGETAVLLPAPSPPLQDLDAALKGRAGRRHYAASSLPAADLAACLAAAQRSASEMPAPGAEIRLLVVARDVEGVPPAVYECDGATLDRRARLPAGNDLSGVVLQAEFADASALVLFVGSIAEATRRWGAHGHRLLHVRAGLAAHGAWLAAEERLLAGCAFAGLLPSFLRSNGLADGYATSALFAFALGPLGRVPGPEAA